MGTLLFAGIPSTGHRCCNAGTVLAFAHIIDAGSWRVRQNVTRWSHIRFAGRHDAGRLEHFTVARGRFCSTALLLSPRRRLARGPSEWIGRLAKKHETVAAIASQL